MSTKFKFANYSETVGSGKNFDWFEWEIFMAETPENLSKVKSVEYRLPAGFPDPLRIIKDRDSRFALRATGTGEFKISITLYCDDGSEESTEYNLNTKNHQKPRRPNFIHPIDKASMVIVPAGTFLYGSDKDDSDAPGEEKPYRELYLPPFYVDVCLVTKAQFCMFLNSRKPNDASLNKWIKLGEYNCRITPETGEYVVEKDFGNHPVTSVSWYGAVEYARWAGKRLLRETEWEKAARGTDGRKFPWGNDFDKALCNSVESNLKKTTEVNLFPNGKSPYGCFDMAGNVWEWTDSGNEDKKVRRGGSFNSASRDCRCAVCTSKRELLKRSRGMGFRCCTDYMPLSLT